MNDQVREIDLLEIFLKFALFIKSNIKSLILFSIIGGFLGLGYYFISTEKYEQVLIGYSPIISTDILIETIDDINNNSYIYALEGSDTLLKEILLNISSIHTEKLLGEGETDEMLRIKFITRKKYSKETLIGIIENCLQKSDFINNSIDEKRNRLSQIISFIQSEIEHKKDALKIDKTNQGDIYINNTETATSLFIQKKSYEKDLLYTKPIIITKALSISKSIKYPIVIFVLIGAFLGFFISGFVLFVKQIVTYVAKSSIYVSNLQVQNKSA